MYIYAHQLTENICVYVYIYTYMYGTKLIIPQKKLTCHRTYYVIEINPRINNIYRNSLQFTHRLTRLQLSNGGIFKMSRSMLHVQPSSVRLSSNVTSRCFLTDGGNHSPHPGICPSAHRGIEWRAGPVGHTTRFQPLTHL